MQCSESGGRWQKRVGHEVKISQAVHQVGEHVRRMQRILEEVEKQAEKSDSKDATWQCPKRSVLLAMPLALHSFSPLVQ